MIWFKCLLLDLCFRDKCFIVKMFYKCMVKKFILWRLWKYILLFLLDVLVFNRKYKFLSAPNYNNLNWPYPNTRMYFKLFPKPFLPLHSKYIFGISISITVSTLLWNNWIHPNGTQHIRQKSPHGRRFSFKFNCIFAISLPVSAHFILPLLTREFSALVDSRRIERRHKRFSAVEFVFFACGAHGTTCERCAGCWFIVVGFAYCGHPAPRGYYVNLHSAYRPQMWNGRVMDSRQHIDYLFMQHQQQQHYTKQ